MPWLRFGCMRLSSDRGGLEQRSCRGLFAPTSGNLAKPRIGRSGPADARPYGLAAVAGSLGNYSASAKLRTRHRSPHPRNQRRDRIRILGELGARAVQAIRSAGSWPAGHVGVACIGTDSGRSGRSAVSSARCNGYFPSLGNKTGIMLSHARSNIDLVPLLLPATFARRGFPRGAWLRPVWPMPRKPDRKAPTCLLKGPPHRAKPRPASRASMR